MGSQMANKIMAEYVQSSAYSGRGKYDQTKEWIELNQIILNNARSAEYILNDLLNYDNIETEGLQLQYTVIPIWNLIGRTFREFKSSAASKNIKFNIDCSALRTANSLHWEQCDIEKGNTSEVLDQKVVGDDERIIQVLRHFVTNAIKGTPDGGKAETLPACVCIC
jgi:signal transduction histidine kinase